MFLDRPEVFSVELVPGAQRREQSLGQGREDSISSRLTMGVGERWIAREERGKEKTTNAELQSEPSQFPLHEERQSDPDQPR